MFPLPLWLLTNFVPVRSPFGLVIYSSCSAAFLPASLQSLSNLVEVLPNNCSEHCLLMLPDSFRLWSMLHFFLYFPKYKSLSLILLIEHMCNSLCCSSKIVSYLWNRMGIRAHFFCRLQIFHHVNNVKRQVKNFLIKSFKSLYIDRFYFVKINFVR